MASSRTVFARMRRSSDSERCSTYQTSSSMRSGHGQRGAALDLGPAGDARPHLEPAPLALGVAVDLLLHGRARADDRHLALEHVDEVGQLVEREAAQQRAPRG